MTTLDELFGTEDAEDMLKGNTRWAFDGESYSAAPATCDAITPGVYTIQSEFRRGPVFYPTKTRDENIVKFPGSVVETIVSEINDFWKRKELYERNGLTFKRGIFMYGPPGTGKSCAIQQVMDQVVELGGIAISEFPRVETFTAAMLVLRKIQPEIPVVAIMEDLDAILEQENESDLLNLLDGVEHLDNIVYLATTNHAEVFEPRIVSRPSRFDRCIEVGLPTAEMREAYLTNLISRQTEIWERYAARIPAWVERTDCFTIAHLKELFIGVCILGRDFEEVFERLVGMLNNDDD